MALRILQMYSARKPGDGFSPFGLLFGTTPGWHLKRVPFIEGKNQCSHHPIARIIEAARGWTQRARREIPASEETIIGGRSAGGDQILLRKVWGGGGLASKWAWSVHGDRGHTSDVRVENSGWSGDEAPRPRSKATMPRPAQKYG